jgi:hypothetical protein
MTMWDGMLTPTNVIDQVIPLEVAHEALGNMGSEALLRMVSDKELQHNEETIH